MKGLACAAVVAAALFQSLSGWAAEVPFSNQAAVINDRLVIAGLVDLEALKAAHGDNVLVVDLRTEAEGVPAEREAAGTLGLSYENIPVSSVVVDPDQVARLSSVLAGVDADTLVVVHCVSGNRAGMLWGASRVQAGDSLGSVKASLAPVLNKQPPIGGLEAFAASLDAGR
jgi:uncharacterized protein (TIGR01244 family)